jgi:hypothetical protein
METEQNEYGSPLSAGRSRKGVHMKKTLKLAAVLGLSLSALVVGGGQAVALPGDQPIWNALGNGMARGEGLIGHADGAPKK